MRLQRKISQLKFFLIFLFLVLVGCSSEQPLKKYHEKLPQKENINASLYHYEMIVDEVQHNYYSNRYFAVLTNYETYLNVFFESEMEDESALNYYVGKSVQKLLSHENRDDLPQLIDYLQQKYQRRFDLGLKKDEKAEKEYRRKHSKQTNRGEHRYFLAYENNHFNEIIFNKKNYFYEVLALKEVYREKFRDPADRKNNRQYDNANFEHWYFLVTRYPSLLSAEEYYENIVAKPNFRYQRLKKANKLNYQRLTNLINNIQINAQLFKNSIENSIDDSVSWKNWKEHSINDKESVLLSNLNEQYLPKIGSWYFSSSPYTVVRNRTHEVNSRNIKKLELWEAFRIVAPAVMEDTPRENGGSSVGKKHGIEGESNTITPWVKIAYYEKEILTGYLPVTEDFIMLPDSVLSDNYLAALQGYHQSDYIKALEIMTGSDEKKYFTERTMVFFYRILQGIARRSTSLENKYTDFALQYNKFFRVSANELDLEVDDFILEKIYKNNPESVMLQYFD